MLAFLKRLFRRRRIVEPKDIYFLGQPKYLGEILERKPIEVTPRSSEEVRGWYTHEIISEVIINPWIFVSEQERRRRRRTNALTQWFGSEWHPHLEGESLVWKKSTFNPFERAWGRFQSWRRGPEPL